MKNIRRGIALAVSLSLISIIVILALTLDKRTFASLRFMNLKILILIIFFLGFSWIAEGIAIKFLIAVFGKKVGIISITKLFLAGNFMGLVTPFGSGAIPAQIFLLTKEDLSVAEATAIGTTRGLLSSWFFGILGPVVFVFFSPVLPSNLSWRQVFGGIFSMLLVASLLFIFFLWKPGSAKSVIIWFSLRKTLRRIFGAERLRSKTDDLWHLIDRLHGNFLMLAKNPLDVLAAMFFVVLSWFSLLMVAPLILIGLGWHGNYFDLFFREFLVFFLLPISPTPGGSGTVEVAFSLLLISLVPKSLLGISVVLWRFFSYYVTMLVGGIFFLGKISKTAVKP